MAIIAVFGQGLLANSIHVNVAYETSSCALVLQKQRDVLKRLSALLVVRMLLLGWLRLAARRNEEILQF